jgi:hypothetical protein
MNTVLAGFAILMAVRLAGDWKGGNERFTRLAERSRAAGALPIVPVAQLARAATGALVAKNLFTPDRNNDRPQETRVQSQPPLPIVIGTMRLGGTYEALMAEAGAPGANRFRRVQQGEQVGPYTVAEIRDEAVVVEFQGQKSSINVYQSAQSVARAAPPLPATAPSPAASPVVESSGSAPAAAAALPSGTTQASSAPSAGVATPLEVKVTIEGNRKRFERYTAFGPQVWYEDITK